MNSTDTIFELQNIEDLFGSCEIVIEVNGNEYKISDISKEKNESKVVILTEEY